MAFLCNVSKSKYEKISVHISGGNDGISVTFRADLNLELGDNIDAILIFLWRVDTVIANLTFG